MTKDLEFLDFPVNRAKFHYLRADKVLREGGISTRELERILKELNRARSLKNNDIDHNFAFYECYKRALDTSSAIFSIRLVIRLDPTKSKAKILLCELLIERGQELMKLGNNFDAALHYFEEALLLDGSRVNIWFLKAVCEVQLRNFPAALDSIDRKIALSGSENDVDASLLRAKILWAMDAIDAGNKDLRKCMTSHGDHVEVKSFISRSFAAAELDYNKALAYQKEGKLANAIRCAQQALSFNGDDIKLLVLLARLYRANGDLALAYQSLLDAENSFRKVDINGRYPIVKVPAEITKQINLVLNEMALQHAMAGAYKEAVVLLNKAIASERRLHRGDAMNIDYKYFMNRGDCYRVMNEPLFAIADYKLALERCPGNWDICTKLSMTHYNLALEYFNSSNFAGAEEQLSGSISLNPKISEYFALRGKARYYQGLYHEAYEDFKACLELNPDNADIAARIRQYEMNSSNPLESSASALSLESGSRGSRAARRLPSKVKIPNPLAIEDGDVSSETPKNLSVSYCTSLIGTINPNMVAPMLIREAIRPRQEALKSIVHTRTPITKGNLWSILQNSSEKNQKSDPQNIANSLSSKKKKHACTVVALKRLSEERSRKARLNPIVAGTFVTENDPVLAALRMEKKLNDKKVRESKTVEIHKHLNV